MGSRCIFRFVFFPASFYSPPFPPPSAPTLVRNVPRDCRLEQEEAFGPVCTWRTFTRWDEALSLANDSHYGLQTGLFTRDLKRAFSAFERLEVGGVVLNDVPSARVDEMPYGGVKDSGLGREGVRSTMEEFTEPRVLLMRNMLHI